MSLDQDFAEFSRAVWPRLNRTGQLLGLSTVDAEELAQSTLVACYARWKKMDRLAESPTAYCFRALFNRHRSRARRQGREVLVAQVPDSPTHLWDEHAGRGRVFDAVRALAPTHREVVACRYYLDLSEAETAAVLGIPVGTAKSRTHRALADLQNRLEGKVYDDDIV